MTANLGPSRDAAAADIDVRRSWLWAPVIVLATLLWISLLVAGAAYGTVRYGVEDAIWRMVPR